MEDEEPAKKNSKRKSAASSSKAKAAPKPVAKQKGKKDKEKAEVAKSMEAAEKFLASLKRTAGAHALEKLCALQRSRSPLVQRIHSGERARQCPVL